MSTEWKEKLLDCDFELAKDEITDFLKMQNEEACRMGGEYICPKEIGEAVNTFLSQPCLETAVKLLECVGHDVRRL